MNFCLKFALRFGCQKFKHVMLRPNPQINLLQWTNYLFNVYLADIRIWLQKLKTSKDFKELIFNTLLFADDHFIIYDTEDNLQKAVYLLYSISEEYNLEIVTKKDESIRFCWNGSPKNKNYYK